MKSKFLSVLIFLAVTAASVKAQTQVNPASQINWPVLTGTTAPTQYCPTTTTGSTVSGSVSVTLASTSGVFTNQVAVGTGIPAATSVVSINSTTRVVTLSQAATVTASGVNVHFSSYGMPYTNLATGQPYVCTPSGWQVDSVYPGVTSDGANGLIALGAITANGGFENSHSTVIPATILGQQGPSTGYVQTAPAPLGAGFLYQNGSGTYSWSGSGTTTNFSAPSAAWPAWLVPTVTNPTTTPALTVAASAIPNSALANAATTVNGQSCALGSTCSISVGSGTVTSFSASAWPSWLAPTVTNATTTPALTVAASAIPNSALANTATTVNGQSCALGGTCSISTGSGTVTSFSAPSASWPTWLVPTVTGSTTTPSLAAAASAIPNSALANTATTVNGQTCTLGGTCTISTGSGTITGVTAGSGISGGGTSGTVTVTNSAPMVYPGSGIPNSTGSAWGTSYGTSGSGSVALVGSPTLTGTPTAPTATISTQNTQIATTAYVWSAISSLFPTTTTCTNTALGVAAGSYQTACTINTTGLSTTATSASWAWQGGVSTTTLPLNVSVYIANSTTAYVTVYNPTASTITFTGTLIINLQTP